MARSSLPPGFRFHPTDVELIMYYLKKKLLGKKLSFEISELNIYKFSPWDLPDKSCMRSKDLEWFFFCPREKKYASGARTNRATESGYWKTTGKDRSINYKDKVVGMIKTLVFHTGHAPHGERTDWVMHEYRFVDSDLANAGVSQDAYVLCKVFQKSGPGPKNGAQYGAPFNEEEWENDEVIAADPSAVHGLSPAAIVSFNNQNPLTSMAAPHSACSWSLTEPGPSTAVPTANGAHPDVLGDDEIASLLDMFTEEPLLSPRSNNHEELNNHNPGYVDEAIPCSDGNDVYTGLGDLAFSASLSESGFNISNIMENNFALNPMFQGGAFLELRDLETPIEFPAEALPPIYATPSNIAVNYGNLDHRASPYPSPLNQLPEIPEGSLWGNGSNILPQEHGVQAAASQGHSYPLYHMDLASTEQREESSDIAAQSQIRGCSQITPQVRAPISTIGHPAVREFSNNS